MNIQVKIYAIYANLKAYALKLRIFSVGGQFNKKTEPTERPSLLKTIRLKLVYWIRYVLIKLGLMNNKMIFDFYNKQDKYTCKSYLMDLIITDKTSMTNVNKYKMPIIVRGINERYVYNLRNQFISELSKVCDIGGDINILSNSKEYLNEANKIMKDYESKGIKPFDIKVDVVEEEKINDKTTYKPLGYLYANLYPLNGVKLNLLDNLTIRIDVKKL